MKYYTLTGGAGKSTFNVSKKFKTRNDAIEYALKMLPLMFEEVQEEIIKSSDTVEYVCSNMCRFTVTRQYAF